MIQRKTIAITPILLALGIVVQLIALVLIVLLYVPCLIWPEILDGPYQWIVRSGTRVMTRAVIGRSKARAKDPESTKITPGA